jgi:hypothetical protein
MTTPQAEKSDRDLILADLRRQRDQAAAIGDHAEALILNDRIKDFKEGRTSTAIERVMKRFESGLARLRAANPRLDH